MENVTIKPAGLSDFEFVYKCMEDLENQKFDKDTLYSIFKEQLNNKNYLCLMAYKNAEPAGMLNMHFEKQLHHAAEVAEISELVVDAPYRSQKIGARLFNKAKEIAAARGCCILELDSNKKRLDAHRFYESHGMNKTHVKLTMDLSS